MADVDDAIILHSEEESDNEELIDRRTILAPAILNVISALGGYEDDTYRLGDEAYGCLKDLKKFWRKDDTDDERTVARIFYEAKVLPNDIVPILLKTAGKGKMEDKCAIACADLVTAMTWPIDMAEELKELDDELDKGSNYSQLLQSHLDYKAALLRPGVVKALLGVMLPCLAKDKKERKERDTQIVNVILHLIRNLAFIRDPPPNVYASLDQAEYSSLQSRLISTLSETHALDLLLTMGSNAASDPFMNQWNTVILEIFYLLFRGVKPADLAENQTTRPSNTLSKLLEEDSKAKRANALKASSRHSRFGTTISVKLNTKTTVTEDDPFGAEAASAAQSSQAFILHRQQALRKDSGSIFDLNKKKVTKKSKVVDALGRDDQLSTDALAVLQKAARTFVEACFNPFLGSLLKDIKSERPKITAKDHVRLLFVTKWFLDFFQCVRAHETTTKEGESGSEQVWELELVTELMDRSWIVWILKRMREAVEEKPKLWTELQAGIECLTQLIILIDTMSSTTNPELAEAAESLQQQMIYNGEILDIAVESLRVYKEGVQSLTYLDSSVHLAYSLLRMLERWIRGKGEGNIVRKRAKPKRKRKTTDDSVPDVEDEDEELQRREEEAQLTIQETSFEAFELKFAHEDITHTLIVYLARWQEFKTSEQMKRVVSLLHRQAVKAKAEGLFFKVSTLNLFKSILAQQRMLPKDQPYKDLISLVNFILRKFFKAVQEDSMVIIEAFFPKNRGRWKQFSSFEPEKGGQDDEAEGTTKYPPDVQIKKGYSWSEQLGIAIACLVEAEQQDLIQWTKDILMLVIGMRQRIVEETDGSSSASTALFNTENADDDAVREAAANLRGPSAEALAKFTDYLIPYVSDEQANGATKNPLLKLVFRLISFAILDDNADELEWYVPAAITPDNLQRSLNVINQFLEDPLDLEGKKASQLLSKKTRRRRRRRSPSASDAAASDSDEGRKNRRERKKKEKIEYKSAQFIEDSDVEYALNDEAFWEKERALREKTELMAAAGKLATMRSTGTKKRKKRKPNKGSDEDDDEEADEGVFRGKSMKKKRKKSAKASSKESDAEDSDSGMEQSDIFDRNSSSRGSTPATSMADAGDDAAHVDKANGSKGTTRSRPPKRPKARPKPAYKGQTIDTTPLLTDGDFDGGVGGTGNIDVDVDMGIVQENTPPKSSSPMALTTSYEIDEEVDSDVLGSQTINESRRGIRKNRIAISDDEE